MAEVFFVIFAPVLALGFGAVGLAGVALGALGFAAVGLGALAFGSFLGALALVVFLGALDLGFETLAGAGVGALSSRFLVLAARGGCLRLGGGPDSGKENEVMVVKVAWLGRYLR